MGITFSTAHLAEQSQDEILFDIWNVVNGTVFAELSTDHTLPRALSKPSCNPRLGSSSTRKQPSPKQKQGTNQRTSMRKTQKKRQLQRVLLVDRIVPAPLP